MDDVTYLKGLTLDQAYEASGREFAASMIGSYERAERLIAMDRLQHLASLYGVAVADLLPDDRVNAGPRLAGKLTIDVAKLYSENFPGKAVLSAFVRAVQRMRRDLESPTITLRDDDTHVIAELLSVTV